MTPALPCRPPDVGGSGTVCLPQKRRRAQSSRRTGQCRPRRRGQRRWHRRFSHAVDGRPSDRDVARADDPTRERQNAGLPARAVGGNDAGEERCERRRGTGDVTCGMGVGVVQSGTVCGTRRGGSRRFWIGGVHDSTVMGCSIVNGGGHGDVGKVIPSMSAEGSRMHWALICLDRCGYSYWQKGPGTPFCMPDGDGGTIA